jgi:hypothetical protein
MQQIANAYFNGGASIMAQAQLPGVFAKPQQWFRLAHQLFSAPDQDTVGQVTVHSGLPAFRVTGSDEFRAEIVQWLRDLRFSTIRTDDVDGSMVLELPINRQATLFKLTWCGV